MTAHIFVVECHHSLTLTVLAYNERKVANSSNSNIYLFSEFEINIVTVFKDDHLVTENFPIRVYR